MSRYALSMLFAAYTCFAWGMITPMTVRLMRELGPERFHPALSFLWNALGNAVFAVAIILITGGSPLKVWSWHWSGWGIFWFWTTGSAAFTLALYFAENKPSVANLVAAAYPALVTAFVMWHFFGEAMTLQKIIGFALALLGVALVILA